MTLFTTTTAQDDSRCGCENCFIGTINVQNSNPNDNGDINLGSTNILNFSTERLSDNSKVADKRNVSIQKKSNNLQGTENVNSVHVSISLVTFI